MNYIIGDPSTACPWCGKQFNITECEDRKFRIICPNSYCIIVPCGIFYSEDDALKALKNEFKLKWSENNPE